MSGSIDLCWEPQYTMESIDLRRGELIYFGKHRSISRSIDLCWGTPIYYGEHRSALGSTNLPWRASIYVMKHQSKMENINLCQKARSTPKRRGVGGLERKCYIAENGLDVCREGSLCLSVREEKGLCVNVAYEDVYV